MDACQGYVNHVTVPQEGQHITATGPYVLDTDHGWTEIHPVYSLTIIGRGVLFAPPRAALDDQNKSWLAMAILSRFGAYFNK
jgi:hypothetical protein